MYVRRCPLCPPALSSHLCRLSSIPQLSWYCQWATWAFLSVSTWAAELLPILIQGEPNFTITSWLLCKVPRRVFWVQVVYNYWCQMDLNKSLNFSKSHSGDPNVQNLWFHTAIRSSESKICQILGGEGAWRIQKPVPAFQDAKLEI